MIRNYKLLGETAVPCMLRIKPQSVIITTSSEITLSTGDTVDITGARFNTVDMGISMYPLKPPQEIPVGYLIIYNSASTEPAIRYELCMQSSPDTGLQEVTAYLKTVYDSSFAPATGSTVRLLMRIEV